MIRSPDPLPVRWILATALLTSAPVLAPPGLAAADAAYPDRLVWVFGWGLRSDRETEEVERVLRTASGHGLTGAVISMGLDHLCRKPPAFFQRLDRIVAIADREGLELIPAVFSVGYGGAALGHDRYLAAGLPVKGAPLRVRDGEARLVPSDASRLENGGFEEHTGDRLSGYRFHDQPGVVSFVDTKVRHGGRASLRMENFTANPHGHGRVMQEVTVTPHRAYRVTFRVRTEDLRPVSAFKVQVLAGSRALAPRTFELEPTGDWRKVVLVFNSLSFDRVRVYAGVWGGRSGRFWLDDAELEEIGPLNVLRRPGTPITVTSDDGKTEYTEGRDYAPLEDPRYSPYRVDREAPPLRVLPGGRIRDGETVRASWYHSLAIHRSQVTVCMAEPKLYEIYDHEAKLLAERLRPKRVLLNMDEVRMGGTCEACRGRDMGQLLGECVTRQVEILRRHLPGVEVLVWSDMLDPHHNAHGDYYLVEGDFTGSWRHVPRDLVVAVWGGAPREKSLQFFSEQGFRTLVACYYDADDLDGVKAWMRAARGLPGIRGFMYTPWQKKYDLLGAFGDLLRARQ